MKTKTEVLGELLDMHASLCAVQRSYSENSASHWMLSAQLSTLSCAIELVRQLPDADAWQDAPDEDGWYWIECAKAIGYVERCHNRWIYSAWCHGDWIDGRHLDGRVRKIAVPQGESE